MRILVLGGTQFIGRHIVEVLVAAGHAVSVLNRGRTNDELPPKVERLRGDRDLDAAGLEALTDREWDACIDVSGYTAKQVRASAELLQQAVGRYVYVSAIAVYGDPKTGPVDESTPRSQPVSEDVTELDQETYGRLKVTCENIVDAVFGERVTVLRPQIVAGPYDPYDRFSYWVRRADQGGEMLVPGDGSDHLQYIDARDCARFTQRVCEQNISGSFNLSGPRLTWAEFAALLEVRDHTWVPKELLAAAGLRESTLPLFRPTGGPRSSLMHVDNQRARRAGLTLTEPEDTISAVRAWLATADLTPALSPEQEAELLRATRAD